MNARTLRNPWLACALGAGLLLTRGRAADTSVQPDPAAQNQFRTAVTEVQKAAHAHADASPAYWTELERGFRRLQRDFPGEAEVYAELLYVADHRSDTNAVALVREILDWPAPKDVKAKARGVLKKQENLGQPYRVTLPGLEGAGVDLGNFAGKVVLVDFWATWCPPCRKELPALKALYERCHGRGLEIVGFSFDEDRSAVKRLVAQEGLAWSQAWAGGGFDSPLARTFGLTSLPTKWLIDKSGRLRDVNAGPDFEKQIERLLAE